MPYLLHRWLLVCSLLSIMTLPAAADVMTAKLAEQWLQQQQHPLLQDSETDHVVSYYYFGRYGPRTLIGLERVRGVEYQSHFSLLIFEEGELLGFYQPLKSLPLSIDATGEVQFPLRFKPAPNQPPLNLANDVLEFMPLCLAEFRPCALWQLAQ